MTFAQPMGQMMGPGLTTDTGPAAPVAAPTPWASAPDRELRQLNAPPGPPPPTLPPPLRTHQSAPPIPL